MAQARVGSVNVQSIKTALPLSTCSHTKDMILEVLPDLTYAELIAVRKNIRDRMAAIHDAKNALAKSKFKPGERVKFKNSKTGQTSYGTLDRFKRKYALIKNCDDGKNWNIMPFDLEKV